MRPPVALERGGRPRPVNRSSPPTRLMTDDLNPSNRTGLVCLACKQPVGVIEQELRRGFTFLCQACDQRWVAQAPGTPKH